MSLEELREQNIRLVTDKALECFIKNGISNTKVSEIAAAAGLTERSVYRYFPTKSDILIASAFRYWERVKECICRELGRHDLTALTGIEQINIILNSYANMLFVDPEGIRFSLDAEVALFSAGKNERRQPPAGGSRPIGAAGHRRAQGFGRQERSIPRRDIKQLSTTPMTPSSA